MKPLRAPLRPSAAKTTALLVLGLAAAAPIVACWGPEYASVHFNSARPDFFHMPQPWSGVPSEKRAQEIQAYEEGGAGKARVPHLLRASALSAEKKGRFREAAALWLRCRAAAEELGADYFPLPFRELPALEDRLAALRSWRGARDTPSLRPYLRARDLASDDRPRDALPLLTAVQSESLIPRAGYLRGAVLFNSGDLPGAARAYADLARRYPKDPLAHYMRARSAFRQVYEREAPVDPESGEAPPPLPSAARTALLEEARSAYEACARVDPGSSLAQDAGGMAAACLYRLGRYPEALLRYCRRLAATRGRADNLDTWVSARRTLKQMSLEDHRRFQQLALPEPEVATAYLDLHLQYGRAGANTQHALGLFALDVLKRHTSAPITGQMLVRLAQIEERFERPEQAEKLAAAALKRCKPGLYQDEARWVHGVALRSLKKTPEALQEFETLATSAGTPKMRRGAHEAAALLAEQQGDYPNAIRHYFALDYRLDCAYLVDIVATPEDLEAFLKRYPTHPQAPLVRYSLGFRRLRAGDYDTAVRLFESLGDWMQTAEKKHPSLTVKGKPRWDPLRTARFFADSKRREAEATTPDRKAAIAYEVGRQLFHQRYELLYNSALWQGSRVYALQIAGPSGQDVPNAEKLLAQHEQEHTSLYQALKVFERIAKDYPKTKEAPKALYSAALCCTLMTTLDSHWSSQSKELTARAIRFYRRLQREYPRDPLAPAAARFGGKA